MALLGPGYTGGSCCPSAVYSFSEEKAIPVQILVRLGRTDNSWDPRAIEDHGAPMSLPKLKKAYKKGTRGISWGLLLTPGPRAGPGFPNGQSAP
ncbi:unnamed protein product, partial [Staurois parvus]